jgi:hypothetical protein
LEAEVLTSNILYRRHKDQLKKLPKKIEWP